MTSSTTVYAPWDALEDALGGQADDDSAVADVEGAGRQVRQLHVGKVVGRHGRLAVRRLWTEVGHRPLLEVEPFDRASVRHSRVRRDPNRSLGWGIGVMLVR